MRSLIGPVAIAAVAVAAGLATLKLIQAPGFFEKISTTARALCEELTTAARAHKIGFCAQSVGSMFGLYFRETPPSTYAEVMQCDRAAFTRFFHAMLAGGIYLAPSAYEVGFVSSAHGEQELGKTIAAAAKAFGNLATNA